MKHYCDKWIEEWCVENGWSDLYIEKNQYWAFRPGAFIPEPIPTNILRGIKHKKGLSINEKYWSITAIVITIISLIITVFLRSPIFLVLAFGIDGLTLANLDID